MLNIKPLVITPEMARNWLANNNLRNRRISDAKAKAYAREMSAGRWQNTHQNIIAFYEDGNIADGQHRLLAIALHDSPIEMMIVRGLPNGASYGIDAHKPRSMEDQIKIGGNDWIDKEIVAAGRMMKSMGGRGGGGGRDTYTPAEIEDFCEKHKEVLLFARHVVARKGVGFSSAVRAAVAVARYHIDGEILREFCTILASGVNETKRGAVALRLREALYRRADNGAGAKLFKMKITMRAIKAFHEREDILKLYEPKEFIYSLPINGIGT